ncbi:MAG: NAD(P)/FAD-dependent oxidoreductase [Actinobacteria bacterium]|nr:NAD(P)/FAD-dependent oxidoreductase [Actinomycetota bacterium]
MARTDYDVVIIGSGVGGLTCASLLSKEGLRVLVLEQSHRIGGCCSNYDHEGFKPDVGAVFVIGHEMYYKLFELLGLRLEDYLEYRLIDPVYDTILDDGTRVLLPRDVDEMAEVVGSISPADVEGYYSYCADMQKIFDVYRAALDVPMPSLAEVSRPAYLGKVAARREQLPAFPVNAWLATRTLDRVVNRYFSDDRIRLMFGWENLYAALPAHRCTGLLSNVTYMGRMGYYYPKGGMISIPKALRRIMERFGGEIRFSTPVEKILVRNGRAEGVRLADGTEISAGAVISNAHSRTTYLDLVGEQHLPYAVRRAVKNQPCSIPAPTFYMGLKQKMDSVRAHFTVLLTERHKFDNVLYEYYDKGLLYRPDDAAFLVSCASHDDPDLAPAGKQVLSVIYIAPYRLKYHRWDDIADEWAWECISSLDRRAFPGLCENVDWMDSVTPVELERRLRLPEGAFFGLEMSGGNMGPFRPNYRSRCVKGLYLTGQCTNPGGGVPLVMLSGIAASSMLVNDLAAGQT